jgi:hypothetical protein
MVLTILAVPAGIFTLFPIDFYSVKYLQVPGQTLALLVASEAAAGFARRPRPLMLACALAFTFSHLARDAVLIGRGRGSYVYAIQYMLDTSTSPESIITAYSNHEFRTQLLIGYHQATLPGRKLRLYHKADLPPAGAEWYILNDHRHGGTGAPQIADRYGNVYHRDLVVRGGGLAPIHWYLYRRSKPPSSGP